MLIIYFLFIFLLFKIFKICQVFLLLVHCSYNVTWKRFAPFLKVFIARCYWSFLRPWPLTATWIVYSCLFLAETRTNKLLCCLPTTCSLWPTSHCWVRASLSVCCLWYFPEKVTTNTQCTSLVLQQMQWLSLVGHRFSLHCQLSNLKTNIFKLLVL